MSRADDILDHINKSGEARQAQCDHGVTFDKDAMSDMGIGRPSAQEVRRRWPRLHGESPKGCGYRGIAYASMEHYIAGDW